MRYGRWEDALVAQTRIKDWYDTPRGQQYLVGLFEDMNRKHNAHLREDPRLFSLIQYGMISEAEPVYVSDEAAALVDHARATFDPEPVLPSDPFVPTGFCLLPHPFMLYDAPWTEEAPGRSRNGSIPVRALAWTAHHTEDMSQGTFWISYYTDIDDEIEMCARDGVPDRWNFHPDGTPNPHRARNITMMRREAPLSMAHMFQWTWGENPWKDTDRLDITPDESLERTVERGKQQAALVQTLWRIAAQFIPVAEYAPRGIRRDAIRKGIDKDHVNVITLRRAKPQKEYNQTDRKLTKRFPVRGYWGRRHTRVGTRQVWVMPHMKGPEDGEFTITERAWQFTR